MGVYNFFSWKSEMALWAKGWELDQDHMVWRRGNLVARPKKVMPCPNGG